MYHICLDFPGPPLLNVISHVCDVSDNMGKAVVQWTQPTNTGGQGVEIQHYELRFIHLRAAAGTCSPGPCDRINATITLITGLECNAYYDFYVRAVNCRGAGRFSNSTTIGPIVLLITCLIIKRGSKNKSTPPQILFTMPVSDHELAIETTTNVAYGTAQATEDNHIYY